MKKAVSNITTSDIIVKLNENQVLQALNLSKNLISYLPDNAIVAIDCVPGKDKLNPIHYVDGLEDLKTLLSLKGKSEEIKSFQNTKRFQINHEAGVNIGLWTRLDYSSYERIIDWENPFVLKKGNGEIAIYHPKLVKQVKQRKIDNHALKSKGAMAKPAIMKFLHKPGINFYQLYHEPLCGPQDAHRIATYRLLVLISTENESGNINVSINLMGGLWTSTPSGSLRLKSANDIRIGLIEI